MKQMYFILIFSVLYTTTYVAAQITKEQVQVIPGELPDPSIIEVDGVYYATGTSGDWVPHYPVYRSTDLEHWKLTSFVFTATPSWASDSFWAPELFYRNGIFYCYYTARASDGISKVGVATTRDISKGFEDQGVLVDWGDEAIDAFVYDEKGTLFITWKAYGLTPDRPIQILASELSADGLSLVGEPFAILTANEDDWENGGIEGQCIVQHEGYLYMLYSGNNCCGTECNYMVALPGQRPWQTHGKNTGPIRF